MARKTRGDPEVSFMNHPQRTIEHNGFAAQVDEELADLILECWRLGLVTLLSCQNSTTNVPGSIRRASITFPVVDGMRFLNIVARPADAESATSRVSTNTRAPAIPTCRRMATVHA